jgi:hypothetical protein
VNWWFLLVAWRFLEQWDVQFGAHFLKVDLDYTTESGGETTEFSGDLGARILTLGGGYHF